MSTKALFLLMWKTRKRKCFIVNACLSETGYRSWKTWKSSVKEWQQETQNQQTSFKVHWSWGGLLLKIRSHWNTIGNYMSAKQQFSYPYAENFPLIAFRDAGSHSKGEKVLTEPEEQIHSFNTLVQKGRVESSFCKWKHWQESWQCYKGEFSNSPGFWAC